MANNMGMYTELVLGVEVRFNENHHEDKLALNALKHMSIRSDEKYLRLKPDHELFKTSRWEWMFWGGSYYFNGQPHTIFRWDDIAGSYFLTTRFNIKNYKNEIEKFLDFISPYVVVDGDSFSGYMRYEENEHPSMIYFEGGEYRTRTK